MRAARKPLAADTLAAVGGRILHKEGDNRKRVIRKSQRPESRTRYRPRRDGPNRHDPSRRPNRRGPKRRGPNRRGPSRRGPSRRPNHPRRQGSIPERQRGGVHNLLFASLLACSFQAANACREHLFPR